MYNDELYSRTVAAEVTKDWRYNSENHSPVICCLVSELSPYFLQFLMSARIEAHQMSKTDFDFEPPRRNHRQREERWRGKGKFNGRKRGGAKNLVEKPRPRQRSTSLHKDIVAFARMNTPTAEHHGECERAVDITRKACLEVFRDNVKVTPFGSFENGLTTKDSDVDLVITGLMKPDSPAGFFGEMRTAAANHLHKLKSHFMNVEELGAKEAMLIGHAKFSLLKVTTITGVMLDISINDDSCCTTAHYVLEKVRQFPPVRPVYLLLKSFLRQYGLSEVKDGGLGGYAFTNMVIAHVLELVKAGIPTHDFGNVLVSFLYHYGTAFDPIIHAVSVRMVGIVIRHWVGVETSSCRKKR